VVALRGLVHSIGLPRFRPLHSSARAGTSAADVASGHERDARTDAAQLAPGTDCPPGRNVQPPWGQSAWSVR